MKLEQLRIRVAAWSEDNFGAQISKHNQQTLGHLAPLLGLVEEYGEYCDADILLCHDGRKDALADMTIYLCDFATRLSPHFNFEDYTPEAAKPQMLPVEIGSLNHHVLKMHQGIRGYDDEVFALSEISDTTYAILDCLNSICEHHSYGPLEDLATEVFNNTVEKRNWKNG